MEFIIMMVLMFGVLFLMTRSTRKRQKEALAFRDSMQPGAQVMTASGYVGTVVEIQGDLVTLETVGGGRTQWVRAAIAKEYESVAPVATEAVEVAPQTSGFSVPDDVSSLISKPGDDAHLKGFVDPNENPRTDDSTPTDK